METYEKTIKDRINTLKSNLRDCYSMKWGRYKSCDRERIIELDARIAENKWLLGKIHREEFKKSKNNPCETDK